ALCTIAPVSANVSQPTVLVLNVNASDATCFGGNDGSVTATFSGGTGPYELSLDGSTTYISATSPHTFPGLSAGSHSVTVRDSALCTIAPVSATVGQPTVLVLNVNASDATCFGGTDGSVTATFSGGTGPYELSLDGSTTYISATSPHTFPGLSAGSHSVTVRDSALCTIAPVSATVGQPTVLVLNVNASDATCFGGTDGSVTATFSGGTGPYELSLDGKI